MRGGKSGAASRGLGSEPVGNFAFPKIALSKVLYHLLLAESHNLQVSLLDFSMGSDTEHWSFF